MPDDADRPAALRLAIDATAMAVREGLRQMLDAAPLRHLSDDARGTAEIVLAEVLNNIVEHAYARWPGTIELTIGDGPAGILCRVEDSGLPMPGGVRPAGLTPPGPPYAPPPLAEYPEGGFGWHLILSLSLTPEYRRIGDRNRLTFGLATKPARV